MAAEQATFGLFAWKKKRDDEFAAACGAMETAMSNMNISVRGNEISVVESNPNASLISNHKPVTHAVATKILTEVKALQKENPVNTVFLTNVLNTTADYIKTPNDPGVLSRYTTMREQVVTKYGRYSALSSALFALPLAVFVGGVIGLTFLGLALPVVAVPLVVTVGVLAILLATRGTAVPAETSSDISRSWKTLGGNMKPSPSR